MLVLYLLGVNPSNKIWHFTVKIVRFELVRLRDQVGGVDTLLQFNEDFANVYMSSLEKGLSFWRQSKYLNSDWTNLKGSMDF